MASFSATLVESTIMRTRFRLLLAILLFVVVACAPADRAAPQERAGASTDSGTLEARIARIEASVLPTFTIRGEETPAVTLAERMGALGVPGVSVAVIEDGEIAWARGWGLADVASGRAVTADTLFQAASISKPVAALAALQMVDQGLIDLDADVNDYLTSWEVPESAYTATRKVTLRSLLNHTAGTTVWGFPGYGPDEQVPSTVGVLDGEGNTAAIRVFKEPGESWRYSGGGYTVMQLLLSDVAGEPFPELMRELVLQPAGMTRSTYQQPLPDGRRAEAATGYRPDGTPVDGNYHTYPEMAAAGLWTTPSDLARYALAVQRAAHGDEDALLSPETTRAMLTPGMNDHGLGPGIADGGARFAHGGSNEGFRCQLTAFVDGGGVVVMTNADAGGRLAQEIVLTVAAEYGWPGIEPQERVLADLSVAELEALVGVYEIPEVFRVEVVLRDERLLLMVPGQPELELLPLSTTSFVVRQDGQPVDFEIDGEEVTMVVSGRRAPRVVAAPGSRDE